MKFVVKKTEGFKKKIIISVSFEEIQRFEKTEIIKIRKTKIINGFRKNKIPIEIIKKKYKIQIEQNALKNAVLYNFQKFLNVNKLSIINEPKIFIKQYPKNKELIYSILFKSIPKIEINKLKYISIQKLFIQKNTKNIEYFIERMRKKYFTWEITNNNITKNDKITIKYKIIKNQEDKNHNINFIKFTFINNSKNIIPLIEKKILNKKTGDVLFVNFTIPKYHPDKKLRGKKRIIIIKIDKIESQKMQYSTKKFITLLIKQLNIKNKKKLFSMIQDNITKEIELINIQYLKKQIYKELSHINNIIPKNSLNKNIELIQLNIEEQYIKNNGNILEKKYHKNFVLQLYNTTQIQLIIQSIIYRKNITVTNQELEKYTKKIHKNKNNRKNQDNIQKIYNIILDYKITNYLLNKFTIQKKYCSLKEAIQINKNNNLI